MLDSNIIQNYAALIFDMDGTLIDTMPSHAKAWEKVGEVLGYPISGDIIYQLGGAPVFTIAEEVISRYQVAEQHFQQVMDLKKQFGFEMVEQNATLLPAFDIVKTYFQQKPMALGTGSDKEMVDVLLDKFALRPYFNAVVDADQIGKHKPHPDTFLRCAELLQVNPKNCLVFEDGLLGIEAALNAGMDVFNVVSKQLIRAFSS